MTDTPAENPTPSVSSHDRLLMAAKRLFAHNGYENTSTVTIAREAGTSESQLMKHFGSKQGLLTAIFERGWERIALRVRGSSHNGTAVDQLLSVLEALLIELENDMDLKELMMLESRRVRKDSRDVVVTRGSQQFADAVEGILSEMRGRKQIRADINLNAVRAAVIGMTEGLIRDRVVARRSKFRADYDLDDARKVLETLVLSLSCETMQPLKSAER